MGHLIASLPQYDLAFLKADTDAWWQGVAHHLRDQGLLDVPDNLTRIDDNERNWRNPDLLLTQTCGYPLMTELQQDLRAVATPVFNCEGCAGGTYSSAVIVHADSDYKQVEDLRGCRAAINNWNSHSGMNALRHTIAPLAEGKSFFSEVVVSGGHVLSMQAVAEGRADVAAIDSVTWALMGRYRLEASKTLRILTWTAPAPSLPYAVRVEADDQTYNKVQVALIAAGADPELASVRNRLLLNGFIPCDTPDYQTMLDFRSQAEALSYPVLA
ncbi:MAG: PhnD/SsuA/transferrin family substrate-binding protein [Alphaproteobacteria bacterium]|nr:PhnD/SsuA/transferrin family substrate-binding protein [Alphaproteobacteria bacterium]